MLKTRIIPIVLIDGYSVLKTIQFDERRNLGNPITVARTYNARNVDELILLDIDASKQNRSIDIFTIQDIASECFMPLTVGGGLKSIEDIESVLKKGADKVSLNSVHLKNFSFIKDSSEVFGAQCIVASVDYKFVDNKFQIYSHSGVLSGRDVADYCYELSTSGAGEILLNSVDLDGQMTGVSSHNLEMINAISKKIDIPLIYAGGVKDPQDCVDIIKAGASAVAAASIFHFTRYVPDDCKRTLSEQGIPARI